MLVLEARPARASLIPTDLGAGLPWTNNRFRHHLDPLLADRELRLLMPESFGPSPEAFFSRPEIVLRHRATCCMCVWFERGLVREAGWLAVASSGAPAVTSAAVGFTVLADISLIIVWNAFISIPARSASCSLVRSRAWPMQLTFATARHRRPGPSIARRRFRSASRAGEGLRPSGLLPSWTSTET